VLSKNDKEAAGILSNKFQQAFVDHGTLNLKILISDYTPSCKDQVVRDLFTEDVVYRKLCMLNPTKSPGPNAVHLHFFKTAQIY